MAKWVARIMRRASLVLGHVDALKARAVMAYSYLGYCYWNDHKCAEYKEWGNPPCTKIF
jgi:hypothetical protein